MAEALNVEVSRNDGLASDLAGSFFYDERGFRGEKETGLFREGAYFYITSFDEKGLGVQYVSGPKVLYDFDTLRNRLREFSGVSASERQDLEQEQRNALGILS